MSKKQVFLLLLIDFSKAFDMVDHNILLEKLYNYGIRGITHDWFKSYLSGRTQYVTIDGKKSSNRDMLYGVPQGSILGPLLFIIYINDVPNISENCTFIMYADDANILISGRNMAEIEEIFNFVAKKLEIWVSANGLSLNLKKTNYMIFSNSQIHEMPFKPRICNYYLERKQSSRFLGVIINEQLTWNEHILAIKAKMSRYVGILYKLKSILPMSARKNIFHSFVQSHLNYCSLVWGLGPKASIEPLFAEQKKAMRALMPGKTLNYYKDGTSPCHTKQFFTEQQIMTVHSIVLTNILKFMHKHNEFKNLIPPPVFDIISHEAPMYNHINANIIEWMNRYNTAKLRNSISFKGPLFYLNYVPLFLEKTRVKHPCLVSHNAFKKHIKSLVLSIQSSGNPIEWEGTNTPLYYVPGMPRAVRKNIPTASYIEFL